MGLDDRPRGILSPPDRRYLKDPEGYVEEYSKQAGSQRRRAIIERVHESLHDYPLLVSALDEESRAEAFEDGDLEDKEHTINILSSPIAFLYLGTLDLVDPRELGHQAFEDFVGDGIKQAYYQRGYSVKNVEVDIEVERGPALEELREEEDLTYGAIRQLMESGELTLEETAERLTELFRESAEDGEEIDEVEVTDYGLKFPDQVVGGDEPDTKE